MPPQPEDITGRQFNRLIAIEICGRRESTGVTLWKCLCTCGNYTVVGVSELKNNNTQSCGCLNKERVRSKQALDLGQAAFNRVLLSYRLSARRKHREFSLTESDFRELIQRPCHYCGVEYSNVSVSRSNTGDFKYNGLDRVDSSRGYTLDNVVSCCGRCNTAKLDMTTDEFRSWIEDVYGYFVKQSEA